MSLAVLLPVLLALAHSGMAAADAQSQMIIGLDMQPATNGPASRRAEEDILLSCIGSSN